MKNSDALLRSASVEMSSFQNLVDNEPVAQPDRSQSAQQVAYYARSSGEHSPPPLTDGTIFNPMCNRERCHEFATIPLTEPLDPESQANLINGRSAIRVARLRRRFAWRFALWLTALSLWPF